MVKKLIVKGGISLIATMFIARVFISRNQRIKQVAPPTNISNVEKKQEQTALSTQCNKLKTIFLDYKSDNTPALVHWTNTYLMRDGIEYTLRIERDSNLQDQEIQRIKFYKLDDEGFPTPYSKFHNTIFNNEMQVKKITEGYSVISVTTLESYDEQRLMFETQDGILTSIQDQKSATRCSSYSASQIKSL